VKEEEKRKRTINKMNTKVGGKMKKWKRITTKKKNEH
jgi:uncharacterized protein with GYD domain